MHDFEHNDLLDDDPVEISDLDTPDKRRKSLPIYQLLKLAQKIHGSPRTRTRLFVLALLFGGGIFTYLFTSYLHIPLIQSTHTPNPTPPSSQITSGSLNIVEVNATPYISKAPLGNIPIVNGVVYSSTQDGTLSARQANDGTLIWQTKTSIPFSQPTMVNNTLYVTSQNSRGSHIDAFRASDGTILWSYQTPQPISGNIRVGNGVIYINTQDNIIYTLRVSDGKLLWHFTAGNPLFLDFSLTYTEGITAIRKDNTVYLLRTQDGSQLWHYTVAEPANALWQPFIQGGIAYIHADKSTIQARALGSGQLLWQYRSKSGNQISYQIQDSIVYVRIANEAILALRTQDGSRIWQVQTFNMTDSWDIQNGIIFDLLEDGSFYALRANDGSPLWQFKLPLINGNVPQFVYMQDKIFYIRENSPNYDIYVLQAEDGKVLWHRPSNNPNTNIMEITNNIIYIKQNDESIEAWNNNNGALLWRYQSPAPIFGGVVEFDGLAYIQQLDGMLVVLHAQNGGLAWKALL